MFSSLQSRSVGNDTLRAAEEGSLATAGAWRWRLSVERRRLSARDLVSAAGRAELRRSLSLGEDALKKVRNVSETFFRFSEIFSDYLKNFQII